MRCKIAAAALLLLVPLLAAACGAGDDNPRLVAVITPSPPADSKPSSPAPNDATPTITEFKLAAINMMSPVVVDTANTIASETYDQRLDALIEELKQLKPDIVVLNEWTNTKAHGNPAAKLGKELKMEYQWVRANPWFPGQSKEQNDAIADQIGFQEGELILSRHRILRAESKWLTQRTSETEGRAVLHVVVQAPDPLGQVEVYAVHLTGGGEKVRAAQANSIAAIIKDTRGKGPVLVAGDLSDVPGTTTTQPFIEGGLTDVVGEAPLFTCCRDAIIGEAPPLATRTLHIFASGWSTPQVSVFGDKPRQRADGSLLYTSDQNGLLASFTIAPRETSSSR